MKYNGTWGMIYGYYWNQKAAAVVCRQLECGDAVQASRGSNFGTEYGVFWFARFFCDGTELTINDCRHSDFQRFSGYAILAAGVVCSGKACLVWQRIPSGNSLSLIPRITENTGSQPRADLGEDQPHSDC